MASVETTGPTVDDAIDAALEKLDLDEDEVDLEILSEGADGQPARVRATPWGMGYGWTPSRVIALAYLIMLASHAAGYAFAAVRSGPALRGLGG